MTNATRTGSLLFSLLLGASLAACGGQPKDASPAPDSAADATAPESAGGAADGAASPAPAGDVATPGEAAAPAEPAS